MKPDAQDLLRLADEVERYSATGPYDIARERERDLNERIAIAIGLPRTVRVGHPVLGNDRTIPARIPTYTASLDAAMTLVPDNVCPGVSMNVHHGDWHAWMGKLVDGQPDDIASAHAFTPALALCAAALKARAHSTKESNHG